MKSSSLIPPLITNTRTAKPEKEITASKTEIINKPNKTAKLGVVDSLNFKLFNLNYYNIYLKFQKDLY